MKDPDESSISAKQEETSLQKALQWPVVRRALIMSAVVGSILVMINHCSCICSGKFGITCCWQSALTFLVPYGVSTVSSVLAMRDPR